MTKIAVEVMSANHVENLAEIDYQAHTYYDAELDVKVTRPGFWTKRDFVNNSTAYKENSRTLVVTATTPQGKYIQGGMVFEVLKDSNRYNIIKFMVDPAIACPNGVRELLLEKLIARVKTNGMKTITITVDDFSYELLSFLRSRGFKAQLLPNKLKPFSDKWFCSLKP